MKPMNLTCTDTSSVAGLRAFSRTEVLVLTGVLGLLLCVVIPALAHDRTRASRVTCANNLRQIGMGFQLWGNDHGDRAVYEVEIADGGTRRHPLAVNTWFHFARLSNELVSPKILLCPSDTGSMATEFTGDPSRGYPCQGSSTIYFVTILNPLSSFFYPSSPIRYLLISCPC